MTSPEKGKPFTVLLIAIFIVGIVSLFPLAEITNGKLKNFNLIEDLFPKSETEQVLGANTYIDPDLLNLDSITEVIDSTMVSVSSFDSTECSTDTSFIEAITPSETLKIVSTGDGEIEDYTYTQCGLKNFKNALYQRGIARIVVIGDSYIEGDIFTQHIREKLQQQYGGKGVGYMPASSKLTGFRQSINQSCSGWKEFDFRNSGRKYPTLQGYYYSPDEDTKAISTFKGNPKFPSAENWTKSTILFIAPEATTITTATSKNDYEVHDIGESEDVQSITVSTPTDYFSLLATSPSLKILGVYLDGETGVSVDNMSMRGYSGIRHNSISPTIASQMRDKIDYNLIVVEYGINALSAAQTNYNSYTIAMEKAIDRIRECYPDADIILMGIGDRGEKYGSAIRSMSTVTNMIDAQRRLARKMGLLFWDTRAAMGGENSVVEWSQSRDINKDYIHLSSKGGERLASLFVDKLNSALE